MSAVAVLAAGVGMGGVAEAATSHISISHTATLKARGAAVVLRVVVQCPHGYQGQAQVQVQVSQRVTRQHVTNGFGGANFTCTGSAQTLRIPATPFDRPYERGVAFAPASLSAFDPNPGMFVNASGIRTIRIS